MAAACRWPLATATALRWASVWPRVCPTRWRWPLPERWPCSAALRRLAAYLGAAGVRGWGGEVRLLPLVPGLSTTELARRIARARPS